MGFFYCTHNARRVSDGKGREDWVGGKDIQMRRMVGDLEFILGVAGVGMVEDGERRCW